MANPDVNGKIFINTWQKGSEETANLGFGTMLGIENYTVKGTARLTKDTVKISGGTVTDLPLYSSTGVTSDTVFIQGDTGKVYKYIVSTGVLTDITNAASTGLGQGLVFYEGYLFAFRAGKIDYLSTPYGAANWTTNWQPNGAAPVLFVNTPIPTIIFPNDGFAYFGTGHRMGKLGFGTSPTFDPTTPGTGYFYSDNFTGGTGLLPAFYQITALSFLPTNYIAIGTSSYQNSAVADIILWNPTLSTYETPLRLFSQAEHGVISSPNVESGIKQLINRNNILYATTGGNHAIFSTNGSTFNQIADLSLYTNIRTTGGSQSQSPVFMNPKLGAIDIFGNKLLTGISTPADISYYPASNGLYPAGVWSLAFQQDGSNSIQCEYTISTNTTVAINQYSIGMLRCIGSNQTLIGWRDNATYGIDLVSTTDYQNVAGNTAIESEMLEIGTPLQPETIQTIQLNTPRTLLTGQTVSFYWRTGFDQNYTFLESFTSANNNDNGYKIQKNDIGATRFLQLKVTMASTSDLTRTPEIRNIIVSK